MELRVECVPGHKGELCPANFHFGERKIVVAEILDIWPGADHRYFKVMGDDGNLYILRHDSRRDLWELTMYERKIHRVAETPSIHS